MIVIGIPVVLRIEQPRCPLGIFAGPELADIFGAHGRCRPKVTIRADVTVDEKVVEQDEFLRQRVLIWCYVFTKDCEPWIAISLSDVTQDLVVGTILLDDVKYVTNRSARIGFRRKISLPWRAVGGRRGGLARLPVSGG